MQRLNKQTIEFEHTIKEQPTFVLATPISGPALTWTPQLDSREMLEPTTLVMPTMRAPRDLQYLRAMRVSAVSPLGFMED